MQDPGEGKLRRGASFVVTRADGRVLVRSRPTKGLLGGMTEVPSTAWSHDFDEADALAQAQGARVEVDVRLDGGVLVLVVRHPGRRTDDARDDVAGAHDRLRAAGGRLVVTDVVGGGTVVRAELPVQPEGEPGPDVGAARA